MDEVQRKILSHFKDGNGWLADDLYKTNFKGSFWDLFEPKFKALIQMGIIKIEADGKCYLTKEGKRKKEKMQI